MRIKPQVGKLESLDDVNLALRDIGLMEKELDAIDAKAAKDIAEMISCSTRTIKDKYLDKMLQAEVVSMTIPDKPTSRNQKYKLVS